MRTAEYPRKLPISTMRFGLAVATALSRILPFVAPMEYMGYFLPKYSNACKTALASPGAAHFSM